MDDNAELAHIDKIIKLKEYKKPLDETILKMNKLIDGLNKNEQENKTEIELLQFSLEKINNNITTSEIDKNGFNETKNNL